MQTLIIAVDVVCGIKKVENHCSKAKCYHSLHHKYKIPCTVNVLNPSVLSVYLCTAQMYQSQSLSGSRRSVAQGALSCFMVLEMDTLLLFFSHSLWLLLCSLPSPLAERLNVLQRQRSAILLFLDHSCFIYAALWYSRILILE